MQLSESLASFEALGVAVAATTYDSTEVLAEFVADNNISYPLLSDQGGEFATALGILNEDISADHFAYGVPHPGILWLDADGQVLAKFAEQDYRKRPELEEVLARVRALR